MEEDGTFEVLPKKEVIKLRAEMEKLNINLGGIKTMEKLPSLIFLVDSKKELICTREARKLGIPTIGLIDSNCNPNDVDFVVPGNDDAVRAVKLVVAKMADAVLTGKNGEPMAEVADEDIHSMEELVKVMGEDKIERKQNRPDRRNNRRFEREEKAEVVESNTVAEAKEE